MSHASTWPLAALVALAAGAMPRSVYTPLTTGACTTVEFNADEGWSTQRCPGTAGYTLLVHEGDARQSIDVVAPGGAAYPLDYWSVVTSASRSSASSPSGASRARAGGHGRSRSSSA